MQPHAIHHHLVSLNWNADGRQQRILGGDERG